ncbi:amidohydrolase [Microbacterium sp. NPDC055903]
MTAGGEVGTLRAVRLVGPGAEFLMDDDPVDLFIADGRIVDIAPTGALPPSGDIWEAGGAWATPGLWDHHVHTVQWALASERAALHDIRSAAGAAHRMADVVPLEDGRRVGAGFRDALWPEPPSLAVLDAKTGEVPTYLVNADVHSVWLNSAALRREGFVSDDGMLREGDAFEISKRLNGADVAHADAAVLRAAARAATRGVTGIVDFDMAWNAETWTRRTAAGFSALRVEFATYPEDLERAIAEGLTSGAVLPGTPSSVRVGPLKIITDGSLGTRTAACTHAYSESDDRGALNVDAEQLTALMTRATGAGLSVAAHAIGDVAAAVALDAFALTGATGTIEHAQLIRHADLARMSRLGIAASIQPAHAVDDRDLAEHLWRAQTSLAYPMRSLRDAAVELRLGSDAPVAPLDPWRTIAAAVSREDDAGATWHADETIGLDDAIRASARSALRPGAVADIAVVGLDPRRASPALLREMPVFATLLGGRLTHEG